MITLSSGLFMLFLLLILVLAFLYASVGHGGASGYLAVMALFNIAPAVMKPTALLLNIFVSMVAFIYYYREKHFNFKIFLPIAMASIPLAYIGGTMTLSDPIYKMVLGIALLFSVVKLLFLSDTQVAEIKPTNLPVSLTLGASIGFLSGLIGIGGGIILSPLLILLKWTNLKQTAAISALFIFVNSLAGIFGQATKSFDINPQMIYYIAFAFIGGLAGGYYGTKKFDNRQLRLVLALVLAIAAVKLILV